MKLDAAAVDSLYRVHGHAVLRRARRILGSEDEARDVVQEIFTGMLDGKTTFRGDSAVTTWLYSATTHGCLNRLRNDKTRARLLAAENAGKTEAAAGTDAESALLLRQLLARVPANLADVAILHYVDEMTHDEIAEVLGCSRRHVGNLLERLHERLREEPAHA